MKFCLSCQRPFPGEDWACPSCGHRPSKAGSIVSFAPELEKENPFFPAESFERLVALEEKYFWFLSRNEMILWALKKWLRQKGKLLEIGCGTGFVLSALERALPEMEMFGSEIYATGLSQAATRLKRSGLFQMDARRIPYRDEFDVIGLFDVLEHIPEDEDVLRQAYLALKPQGGLLLTVPQHGFLWSYVDEISHHVRRYERRDLLEKVKRAGFEVVETTSFVSLLMPGLLLSR